MGARREISGGATEIAKKDPTADIKRAEYPYMVAQSQVEEIRESEASEENAPMGDYLVLIGIFNALLAVFVFLNRRTRPETPSTGDLLLLGLATQKLSRVVTRDRVTQPIRRPFAQFEKSAGAGEVEEKPRGHGLRKAIGELITCPYCLGTWIASGLIYGFTLNPSLTRLVASIFAVGAVADSAQHGYAKLKEVTE